MNIDLKSIDRNLFLVEENVILSTGETIYFVRPNPAAQGMVWTQKNKYLRSCVLNTAGDVISAGFPKFEDFGVNSENFPPPTNMNGASAYEKLDGALLSVSQYKRHKIIRTRGTLDAFSMPNGKELDSFRKKILPRIDEYFYGTKTWNSSFLFEWLSQKHGLVVNYGEQVRFVLVGLINHENYSLAPQHDLNQFANSLALERPRLYTVNTLEGLVKDVSEWNDREGVVLYSNGDQSMHRIKSLWYKAVHRLRTEEPCIETIIDAWFAWGKLSYSNFLERLEKQFDTSFAEKIRPEISRIADAWKEVDRIVKGFTAFSDEKLKGEPLTMEEAEKYVYSSFGKTNRAEYVLKIYKGQTLNDEELKKLLYQCLKKGK